MGQDPLERYVLMVAMAGGVAAALAYGWAVRPAGEWALPEVALLATLVASYFALQRRGFIFHWRHQRVVTTLDEPVVFIALVALPWPSAVAVVFAGTTFAQVVARRKPLKSLFNIASYSLAAGLASLAFGILAYVAQVPVEIAAVAGTSLYTLTSDVLTAGVFARAEGVPTVRVLRQRFLLSTLPNALLGSTLGFVGVVLWSYHPAAALALMPLAALALGFGKLNADAERALDARRSLAEVSTSLIGTSDDEKVIERILEACSDLFHGGRVELFLPPTRDQPARERVRETEGGPAPGAKPLTAPLIGRDGAVMGELRLWPSARVRSSLARGDESLLRVVAGQAASALESAWTLRELIEAHRAKEAALRSQTLTRPFVRRLVLSIVSRMNAPRNVINEVGRGLAELDLRSIDAYTEAFRSMGLGNLRFERREGESYVFSADDLLERQMKSNQPTCHLALGFVEGAVASLHGASLGSELRCQSQGHPRCEFVVQPRAAPRPRVKPVVTRAK